MAYRYFIYSTCRTLGPEGPGRSLLCPRLAIPLACQDYGTHNQRWRYYSCRLVWGLHRSRFCDMSLITHWLREFMNSNAIHNPQISLSRLLRGYPEPHMGMVTCDERSVYVETDSSASTVMFIYAVRCCTCVYIFPIGLALRLRLCGLYPPNYRSTPPRRYWPAVRAPMLPVVQRLSLWPQSNRKT